MKTKINRKRDKKGRFVDEGKLIKKVCLWCKKEFYTYVSQNCKFCSITCSGKFKLKRIPNVKLDKNLAYILGVLCGDGYISKSKNSSCEIGLRTTDEDFALSFKLTLEKVYQLIPKVRIVPANFSKIRGKMYKCKRGVHVRICSKKVYENILSYNITGKFKEKTWRVPKEVMNSKDEKIIGSFLRGFSDSEATVREYCTEIASSNKRGLDDIKKLLSCLGIKRFYFYKDWKNVWKLIFAGKDNLLLFYIKVGFTIQRKQKILKESIKYKCRVRGFKTSDYWYAIKLRKKGYGYRKISDILKINADTIRGWCKRGNISYDIQRQIKLRENLNIIKRV